MRRAHDVGGVGFQRMFVGVANERLRREVEDEIRPRAENGFFYCGRIADIGNFVFDKVFNLKLRKNRRRGGGRLRKTVNTGAKLNEPACEPGPFESGVTGKPDGFTLE